MVDMPPLVGTDRVRAKEDKIATVGSIAATKKSKSALKFKKAKFEKEMGELANEMPHLFSGKILASLESKAM